MLLVAWADLAVVDQLGGDQRLSASRMMPGWPRRDLVIQRVLDRRLDQSDLGSAIESRALEAIGQHAILLCSNAAMRIGELDFAAGAWPGRLEQVEDPRTQDVAADHGQRARRDLGLGFLDDRRNVAVTVG